jgi:hypothetical protein
MLLRLVISHVLKHRMGNMIFLKPKETISFEAQSGERQSSQIQGRDTIVVEASAERLSKLISNSLELCNWGPPVRGVKVLSDDGQEGPGTWRRVDAEFDGEQGHFIERRIDHIEGRKIVILIEEETFGLFRLLSEVGSSLEIEPLGPNKVKVIFTFFHNTKGVLGHVMNVLFILRQQRRNRLVALASLKKYAEQSSSLAEH